MHDDGSETKITVSYEDNLIFAAGQSIGPKFVVSQMIVDRWARAENRRVVELNMKGIENDAPYGSQAARQLIRALW